MECFFDKESGDGYSDIVIETDDGEMGIILELKYAQDGDLETACQSALEQIGGNNYIDILEEDGVEKILKYGIAFYKKRCRVMIGENPDAGIKNLTWSPLYELY